MDTWKAEQEWYSTFTLACINKYASEFQLWIVWYPEDPVCNLHPAVVLQASFLRPRHWWMEMFQAGWETRCIRGQHSKGVTNWIMTHEGQIWARDLASKVTLRSRSVLHSSLLILSLPSGTPAFTALRVHARTHIKMYNSRSAVSRLCVCAAKHRLWWAIG